MAKLWGGRFQKKTDSQFERFSGSFKWDKRLLSYDLKIDAAHVRALARCGVLTSGESKRLLGALTSLERKYNAGSLRPKGEPEDVHSFIQEELSRIAGDLANKIHAGRSRNDLVSQSSRLYCKDCSVGIASLITDVQKALVTKADSVQSVLLPGMTHMQNAQVLSAAHIFLAYAEMLGRVKSLFLVAYDFSDVCVLGSGALAGTTFALDQKKIAKDLGLSRVTNNSYDVSGDRDFVLAFLSASQALGVALSRMAEDWMLWQTKGFSLVDIDQAFCTGSSMMPQKKNADFVELLRGSAGIFSGNLQAFVVTLKGLPTSYNRDLQWDKRVLFDSAENAADLLEMTARVVKSLTLSKRAAAGLLDDESLYATDLADYLVQKGTPFKEAHHQVGQIVSFAESKNLKISQIGLDLIKKFAPKAGGDVYDLFDASHSVRMKKTQGSTHPAMIRRQIARWQKELRHS